MASSDQLGQEVCFWSILIPHRLQNSMHLNYPWATMTFAVIKAKLLHMTGFSKYPLQIVYQVCGFPLVSIANLFLFAVIPAVSGSRSGSPFVSVNFTVLIFRSSNKNSTYKVYPFGVSAGLKLKVLSVYPGWRRPPGYYVYLHIYTVFEYSFNIRIHVRTMHISIRIWWHTMHPKI